MASGMRRPETPSTSLATDPNLMLAPSSNLRMRLLTALRSTDTCARLRLRSTKLFFSSPCRNKSAIHSALIRLEPRHLFNMRRIAQRQIELSLQHRPYGLPVGARGLHGHVRG